MEYCDIKSTFLKPTDGVGRLTVSTEGSAQLKCEINLFYGRKASAMSLCFQVTQVHALLSPGVAYVSGLALLFQLEVGPSTMAMSR